MLRAITLLALAAAPVFAQSPQPASFAAADIHPSPHITFSYMDGGFLNGERYVIHQASMLDLIATAYDLDRANIQGGPAWLERDRFEIVARAPRATPKAKLRLMLQGLLAERFQLVTHTGAKPMPAYILTLAKEKPAMKPSEGTGDPACHDRAPEAQAGTVASIDLVCRNMTMDAFAEQVRMMADGYLDKPVINQTGLGDAWDFDLRWTAHDSLKKAGADGISIFAAVEKLGLKLELKTAPRPVLIVDSVNRNPTPNRQGIEALLPPAPSLLFENAVIKPATPGADDSGSVNGNRIDLHGISLKDLITWGWDLHPSDKEVLIGAPAWLDSNRFDILATIPHEAAVEAAANGTPSMPRVDDEQLRAMLRALVNERFHFKSHPEQRLVSAYTLVAVKPKLIPANSTARAHCNEGPGPDGKDPRITSPVLNRLVTCENMTMAEIAQEMSRVANGYIYSPVKDATGLPGTWSFTLSFSSIQKLLPAAATNPGSAVTPSEPNGALSFFDAVSRQLGVKLEKEKRFATVLVIDHIDENPTEN